MPAVKTQSNYWCFTWAAPHPEPTAVWNQMAEVGATCLHMQKEAGGATGLVHLQGYVEFGMKKRVSSLKKIDKRIHWESRIGTAQQAVAYVTKDDTRLEGPWHWGDLQNPEPQQGRRSDLHAAHEVLQAEGIRAVAQQYPLVFMRNYRGFEKLLSMRILKRPVPPTVTLLVGPPGCGKSHWVDQIDPLYRKPVTEGFWFDNYYDDPNVLIDEFEGAASKWSLSNLNQVIDRYPVVLPNKGGFTQWCPLHIYITTNTHPRHWYNYDGREDRYQALARRFTKVILWTRKGEEPFMYQTEDELKEFF